MGNEKKGPGKLVVMLSVIAILAGVWSFLVGGMKGRSAGWEMMILYAAPAAIAGLLAFAMHRSKITYAAVVCGVGLGLFGFWMGL